MKIYNAKNDKKIGSSSIAMNKDGTTLKDYIGTEAIVEGSGTEFNLSNCLNKKLKDFKGYGDTEQESLTGRNLLNTPYNENNKLSITSTKDDYVTITDYYAYLEANKTYTFSCESDGEAGTTTGSDTIEIFLLKDKGYDKYYFQHNSKTFTFLNTVAGNYYIRIDVNKNNVTHKFWNFYIAEENSFSGYEPYCGGIPAPNPEYPMDINTVTGRQVVKVNSKNKFNIGNDTATNNGVQVAYNESQITLNGTSEGNGDIFKNGYSYMSLGTFKAGTYTFSYTKTGTITLNGKADAFYIRDASGNSIFNVSLTRESFDYTFTLDEATELKTQYFVNGSGVVFNNAIIKFQIESGSTATSYVPYQHEEHEINLGNIELCKIGTYQDYIYKNNGNWYKHSEVGKTTDVSGNTSITINDMVSNGNIYSYYGGAVSGKVITYNSALSGTNTIYYQLETSTTTQITDTTLISQLNAIKPLLGDNIITVTSNNEPAMSVEIEAYNNNQSGINQYIIDNL